MSATFPFSAVVGHEDVKTALLLSAVDPRIGGVLLRGEKGSAKSTLARGLAALLPGGAPFVELPVGATEDRVVGSIDLAAALTGGGARLQHGLLHAAHGGVLYVDEVNLLPDHLVDVLLDVAASGVNRVEREGVSIAHDSRFVLVGSMNPEEGDLRPQLLDRFGLSVDVSAPTDPAARAEAVRRRLDFDADPDAFAGRWREQEAALAARLGEARPAGVPDDLVETVSAVCVAAGAEGLRADIVICRAAAALAGWEGRSEAGAPDVSAVARMALAHRQRRSPLDQGGIDQSDIDDALERHTNASPADPAGDPPSGTSDGPGELPPDAGAGDDPAPARVQPPASAGPPSAVDLGRVAGRAPGAHGRRSPAEGRTGRLVGERIPTGPVASVAVAATLRSAATRVAPGERPTVTATDVREAVREHKAGNLLVLAVDASGSMGAGRRMEAVKGAVLGVLVDAYQRRDRVALVVFRGEEATVALRPTGSVEVARARLAELPTGGATPLAAGITAAVELAASHKGGHRPLLVVVSDGRATAGPPGVDPFAAALDAARRARSRGVPAVVLDAEDGPVRLGLAVELADALGGRLVALPEVSTEAVTSALRLAMDDAGR